MRKVAIVNQEVRVGLIEKVRFKQRLEGRKAIRQVHIQGKDGYSRHREQLIGRSMKQLSWHIQGQKKRLYLKWSKQGER